MPTILLLKQRTWFSILFLPSVVSLCSLIFLVYVCAPTIPSIVFKHPDRFLKISRRIHYVGNNYKTLHFMAVSEFSSLHPLHHGPGEITSEDWVIQSLGYEVSTLLGTAESQNLFLHVRPSPIPFCLFILKNSNPVQSLKSKWHGNVIQDLRNYDWWGKGLDWKVSISRLDIELSVSQWTVPL